MLQCVSGEGALNKLLYKLYLFFEKSKLGDGVPHNRTSMWHWQRLSVPHSSLSAAAQVTAGLWHLVSMACQLKANVPTCPPLYVAPLRILTGLSYCVHTKPKATGHLHLRGGGRECLCGQSQWRVSERALCVVMARRGKEERITELPSVFGS